MIDYGTEVNPEIRMEMRRGYIEKISLYLPDRILIYEVGQKSVQSIHIIKMNSKIVDFEVVYLANDTTPVVAVSYTFAGSYLIRWGVQEFE